VPDIQIQNPETMGKPLGQYSQLTRVKTSELIFVAGQLSVTKEGEIVGRGDFAAQCEQVFSNIATALESQGASWENIVQFTTYLVHSQDIENFMAYRLRRFPDLFPSGAYPPNTLLMVDRLVEEFFLVEVQVVAAL